MSRPSSTDVLAPTGDERRTIIVLLSAVTLIVVHFFHASALPGLHADERILGRCVATIVGFLLVPALIVRFVLRERLRDFGLTLGQSTRYWRSFVALLIVFVLVAVVLAGLPGIRAVYPEYRPMLARPILWLPVTFLFGAASLSWEFLFRGFIQMSLERQLGRGAIAVQLIAFVLVHLSKNEVEAFGSIGAGVIFGWMAWRSRSIVPGWLCHWTLSTTVNLLVAYGHSSS